MRGEVVQLGRGALSFFATISAAIALSLGNGLAAQAPLAPVAIAVPNAGFEEGAVGEAPPRWGGTVKRVEGETSTSYLALIDIVEPREGRASVRLEQLAPPTEKQPFGTVVSTVDAKAYRGSRVKLTGAVRTEVEASAHVGLWLRIDRAGGALGAFDNMSDRPIRSGSWSDYSIEVDVAADAERLVFGFLLNGAGRAWLDDIRLEVIGAARSSGISQATRSRTARSDGDEAPRVLDDREVNNFSALAELYGLVRYFHPSDEAVAADWDRIAIIGVEQVESATNPAELAAALQSVFAPIAGSVDIFLTEHMPPRAALPPGASAVRWRHKGIGEPISSGVYLSERITADGAADDDVFEAKLAGGVTVRMPMVLWRNAAGKTIPRGRGELPQSRKPAGFVPSGFDRTTRLAAVVEGWSTLQHSYPYFDVVKVDWKAQLRDTLRAAARDRDDLAFQRTLRRMMAALKDGHGYAQYAHIEDGILPLAWEEVEGSFMVTAVGEGVEGISRGDIVTHIGGTPVERRIGEIVELTSGSRQWTRHRALAEALMGKAGATIDLDLLGPNGSPRKARLAYRELGSTEPTREAKPDPIAELAPGIFYVDLDRANDKMILARDADLVAARGLIFDLRGYPRGNPPYLARLARRRIQSAHMDAPVYIRPDRRNTSFEEGGWTIEPQAPPFTDNVVFITNGSAISYAESVLGVVKGNRLGDIVGEASAGANGNVITANLPGGYRLMWTGMKVFNRDGSQHHLVGVTPTVPVSRTIAGVRAGRDEMLEKALEIVGSRMR